jgi:polysaccharide biosynthesis/export protein
VSVEFWTRSILRVAALAATLLVVGCAADGDASSVNAAQAGAAAIPLPAATTPSPGSAEYRVVSDDILQVVVYQVTDFNREAQVDGAGNIVLPLIGAVPAAGRTIRQIEDDIARRLRAKYLQNPQVSVIVKDAIGQRVTIEGAVQKPGVISARGNLTLLSALAQANGFTELADRDSVLVFRNTAEGRAVARFDANAIRSGKAADPQILGGDTIVVDESGTRSAWKQFREAVPAAAVFKLFM